MSAEKKCDWVLDNGERKMKQGGAGRWQKKV